jgi:hypothetical protein
MNGTQIYPCDISSITNQAYKDGLLQVMPIEFYKQFSENEIKFFMYKNAIYVLPTTELIEWLKQNIVGSAIEIGAGHGAIARALNIPITDSRLQENLDIKIAYAASGQPVIEYANDVEKLTAFQAVNKYKPHTVIGAFITHKWNGKNGNYWGVDENELLKSVMRYIHIGNKETHQNSAIMKLQHDENYFDWLITRSVNQSLNRIFVWSK